MFAGHFGLAASVKGTEKHVPVLALMVSTQLLDLVFSFLMLFGIERMGGPIEGTPYTSFDVDYSHSLVGALLISVFAGWIGARFWGKNGGMIVVLVSFSHWILDLIVHVPDLAILPGNLGNLPYLGLGLWRYPLTTILVEGVLILIGIVFYFRYIYLSNDKKLDTFAIVRVSLMVVFLAGVFVIGLL